MMSVALELNNLSRNLVNEPNAPMYPETHKQIEEMKKHPRTLSPVKEFGANKVQSYGYTDAQWRSIRSVTRLLLRVFPGLTPAYPKNSPGALEPNPITDPESFSGFIGHHGWEPNRSCPGPGFDWTRLEGAFSPLSSP